MGKIPCFLPDKQGRQCPGFRERHPSRTSAPPFFKALRTGCLFCWDYRLASVGTRPDFLSIEVLERYLGQKERPVSGPCSLTGKMRGSTSLAPRLLLPLKIHLSFRQIHKLAQC